MSCLLVFLFLVSLPLLLALCLQFGSVSPLLCLLAHIWKWGKTKRGGHRGWAAGEGGVALLN